MPTRRGVLQALIALPLAARGLGGDEHGRPGRGQACALGEDASAALLPEPRRKGESLALALAGSQRPEAHRFGELTGSSESVWLELSPLDRGGVDDGPLAERIRRAASVTLIEGELLDWLVTLWPARRSSAVLGALAECAYTGGRLIGRGSTSILVAGGVARGATRDEAGEARVRIANPRESGEARMVHGLGLCSEFFVDTQARSSGSLLRLLSTLIENHEDHGVHLGARSALCCDLETRGWVALGDEPLIVLDLSGSRRLAESIEGAQLSVLTAGDGWRTIDRSLFSTGEATEFGPADDADRDGDGLSVARLLAAPVASRTSRCDRSRVELRRGANSRAFKGPSNAAARAQRLLLDVALARGRWGELGA